MAKFEMAQWAAVFFIWADKIALHFQIEQFLNFQLAKRIFTIIDSSHSQHLRICQFTISITW